MNTVFRLRKDYLALAIVFLVFLLGMGALACYAAVTDVPAGREAPFLILTLGILGFLACLDLWLLLACWREALTVQEERIIQRGVFSTKGLSRSAVTEVDWRVVPAGGSVVLKTADQTMKIEFSSFEHQQRLVLIRHLRNALPSSVQGGWPLFCYKIALPLRKSMESPAAQAPNENEVRITRRRWDWYFAPGVILAAAIGVYLWRTFGLSRSLVGPLPLLALWLFVRWKTPVQGLIVPVSADHRSLVAWFSLALFGVFPLIYISKQLEKQHPGVGLIAFFPFLAFFPWIIRLGVRQECRQKERALEATPAAVEKWERQEAASC